MTPLSTHSPATLKSGNSTVLEIRQLENRRGGERSLQCFKRRHGLRRPRKPIFLEELGERRRDRAIVLDEPTVIARQAQEAAEAAHGARLWLGSHRIDLVLVHGDTICQNDVAKIGH